MSTPSNCLRNVVCWCPVCQRERDVICRETDTIYCEACKAEMKQHWWKRRSQQSTVWDQREWATVFKKPDGSFSFPARSDKPTPDGFERITIKSDADAARIEKESGTRMERRWFDLGSGAGFDTKPLPPTPWSRG